MAKGINNFSIRFKTNKGVRYIPLSIDDDEYLLTMELWMEVTEILPLLIFPFQLNEQGYVRRAPYEDDDE